MSSLQAPPEITPKYRARNTSGVLPIMISKLNKKISHMAEGYGSNGGMLICRKFDPSIACSCSHFCQVWPIEPCQYYNARPRTNYYIHVIELSIARRESQTSFSTSVRFGFNIYFILKISRILSANLYIYPFLLA